MGLKELKYCLSVCLSITKKKSSSYLEISD